MKTNENKSCSRYCRYWVNLLSRGIRFFFLLNFICVLLRLDYFFINNILTILLFFYLLFSLFFKLFVRFLKHSDDTRRIFSDYFEDLFFCCHPSKYWSGKTLLLLFSSHENMKIIDSSHYLHFFNIFLNYLIIYLFFKIINYFYLFVIPIYLLN